MGNTATAVAQQRRVSHRGNCRAEDLERCVNRRFDFTVLDELRPYCERYARAKLAPLDARMRLGDSPLVSYDPLHLDGLLSYAVLYEATDGHGIEDESGVYYIPLPLMCLWSSHDGLPLWATSVFLPDGGEHKSTVIMHKKHKYPFVSRTGRWMDTRTPKPVAITSTGWWKARCFGNRDEIERLLTAYIHSVGKHRHEDHGHVKEWRVDEAEFLPHDTVVCDGHLIRPIPQLALGHFDFTPEGNPGLVAWTQPYWKPRNFNHGWRTGTRVNYNEVDFFNAM